MAKITKNGSLAGTLGEIVFVNDGGRKYTRRRPEKVKQSPRTKAAAGVFGLVSTREKLFRLRLLKELGMPPLQYFATKHRARVMKTVTGGQGITAGSNPGFGNPQALAGFSFNPKMEWQACTNFFPAFEMGAGSEMMVQIPELKWKHQITPPKNSSSAVLTLLAITADLNVAAVPVKVQAKLEMEISGSSAVPAQEWIFPVNPAGGWLLIAGCLRFDTRKPDAGAKDQFSAAYLWAGLPGE